MGKPRATRKKPIVLSSDDENEAPNSPPPNKRPRKGSLMTVQDAPRGDSRTLRSQTRQISSINGQSLQTGVKSPSKVWAKPQKVHTPITSFFNRAPPARSQPPSQSSQKKTAPTPPLEGIDDIVDSSEDERSATALPLRKRIRDAPSSKDAASKGSQRFLSTATDARKLSGAKSPPLADQDRRPWNEKYGPASIEELAVHKRKVADVRTWLSDVFNGSLRKSLLILKGPAGCGKTATMSLLSRELGFNVKEWKNPATMGLSSEGSMSLTAQFDDFVGRAGAFGSLTFNESSVAQASSSKPDTANTQRQLILVEEFPNTFTRASTAVQSFRSAVLGFLAANTPSADAFFTRNASADHPVTPIVMIISETLLSTNTAAADSFTAHRLLGPEILSHAGVSIIEFNPIAPTFMTKALELVVQKEARRTGRKKSPGPQVMQRLAELGDIRNAISSLEFLCVRGDAESDWGSNVNLEKKKAAKDVPMTKMEQESLEMVTQRESTLGIFHAVGRVVYNKRLPADSSAPVPQPPHWFPERRRPKASEVNLDTLIDELGTDTQTFIAALHENYVLSCGAGDSEETMDALEGCIDALSDADLLSPDRFSTTGFGRRGFQGTSADQLRQDEMSFQTTVRGLLYSLPSPVKRVAPPPGRMGGKGKTTSFRGNAQVMYYPTSLRLWRQQEELGGLLEVWISRIQRGDLSTLDARRSTTKPVTAGGVDTWRRTNAPFNPRPTPPSSLAPSQHENSKEDPAPVVLLGSGSSARYELLFERLPYLTRILRKPSLRNPATAAAIREIQKLTSFTGTSMRALDGADDNDDAEDVVVGETELWSTDKPAATPQRKKRVKFEEKRDEGEGVGKGERLVLSDDDIED
ncbi:Rad17-domain-containing protein [Sporormia fimetaria CBS 119925]|uniref:Rad17-domain-containing protein n=1 Tax=Sporormia fimetaria CBS 119925 TaxID=1340428 RepID=A0A6A6VMQ1_9PLEO|nr:Rad17-domain-containing protein [Sporormia fimetaria CBS 119925]